MDINVQSGDKKIVASGVFITDDEENHISLNLEKGVLNFVFLFKNDKNEKESGRVKWYPKNADTGLIVEFINFNDNLGNTSIEPMLLASFNNKELYLKCKIKSFDDKTKIITYTFFIKN